MMMMMTSSFKLSPNLTRPLSPLISLCVLTSDLDTNNSLFLSHLSAVSLTSFFSLVIRSYDDSITANHSQCCRLLMSILLGSV